MIGALIAFELRRRLKQLSTYVYGVVLFAAGFFMMLANGGVFRDIAVTAGNERVLANSPHTLFGLTSMVALFSLFTVAAVFGQAVFQDFGHDTWMIIFTKNVKKVPYLLGRFLGALVFSAGLFLAIGVGEALGSIVVHFVKPDQLGPTTFLAYFWPYVVSVWPTLLFTGALFFALAGLTRRMAPVYVGVVLLVLGYLLAQVLLQDVKNQTLAALLDPFGFLSFEVVTRYWTPAERNRDLAPLFGLLGANRLIWAGVGLALLALTVSRFRTTVDEHRGRAPVDEERSTDKVPYPTVTPSATATGWVRASASFAWMYFREVTRSPVYWAFVVSGLVFVVLVMAVSKEIFGTPTLPVTYQALELARGSFGLFTLITVIFYAGELVWRDRDAGTQDIIDSTRVPTWVGFGARLAALLLVALSLEVVIAAAALIAQVSRGFFAIEPRLYVTELLVFEFSRVAVLCALALTVQVVLNHKYLGHFAMVGYYVLQPVLGFIGVEERLLRYGSAPEPQYSDMNGYGHFVAPWVWFRLYWVGVAGVLLVAAYLLFVRGRETSWRARRGAVRARFTWPWRLAGAVALALVVVTGGYAYWATHVVVPHHTSKDRQRDQARYEKTYKKYEALPQPRIVDVDVRLDVYPSQQRLVAAGTYRLKNKTEQPVTRVFLDLPDEQEVAIRALSVAGTEQRSPESDPRLGTYLFDLPRPLAPGDEADLTFELEFGSKNLKRREDVVENGTFFNNFNLPGVGYQARAELSQDSDREDYDLPPKERMAPRDDAVQLQHNYIRQDSDFVTYRATVSTDPGQIAVAPGYLEKEWVEDGPDGPRPHWRYVMDRPILNFFSVLSARYAVKRDRWNDVALEIYHHPTHAWNLERMMSGMKDALAYCTENFGPYQYRQARILEFPRYASFAQSFPNTIPYSEAVGFIARVRDDEPDDLDYPYYVTAHEIAHQWWAHQVVGANVRGATMTSESMAQYSALMVMKKKYGAEKMRRFLKFELDRYLVGRATERKKELPLAQNENQMYIHYQKGSVAMYALQDFIGEDRVNRALRKYVEAVRFQGPPYTTSADLVAALREETPPEYAYLIDDLFETITLYDNRTEEASMAKNAAGGWDVTIRVRAQKLRSDEKGEQTELTDWVDWMDVGAIDDKGAALFTEKRKVHPGAQELTFTVATRPARVGVDPLNKLIDRNSEDNVKVPSER